jgi:hypothetical protein
VNWNIRYYLIITCKSKVTLLTASTTKGGAQAPPLKQKDLVGLFLCEICFFFFYYLFLF